MHWIRAQETAWAAPAGKGPAEVVVSVQRAQNSYHSCQEDSIHHDSSALSLPVSRALRQLGSVGEDAVRRHFSRMKRPARFQILIAV